MLRPLPRRTLCVVLLLMHASACTQWRRLPGTAEENVGRPSIGRARLVMRNGSEIILRDVLIRPDSIVGKTVATYERRAVSTADVSYVDSRRPWTDRTAGGLTGLAIVGTGRGERLYAANFVQGTVDVFDSAFKQVRTGPRQFVDPRLPKGYLPFNTQALHGDIFVTYDKADPATHRQAVGEGLGVVDEYSADGHLISRIASGGALDAPWGLAIAPRSWRSAAGSLLVGNFGDGRINIIRNEGRHYAHQITGQVRVRSTGKPFAEPGLWALERGTATNGGTDALWFTAGINHEQNGLLGILRP